MDQGGNRLDLAKSVFGLDTGKGPLSAALVEILNTCITTWYACWEKLVSISGRLLTRRKHREAQTVDWGSEVSDNIRFTLESEVYAGLATVCLAANELLEVVRHIRNASGVGNLPDENVAESLAAGAADLVDRIGELESRVAILEAMDDDEDIVMQ